MKKTEKNREKSNIILSVVIMLVMATLVVFISDKLSKTSYEDESIADDLNEEIQEELVIWYYDAIYTDYIEAISAEFKEDYDVDVTFKKVSADGYLEAINQANVNNEDYPDVYILPEEMLEKAYLGGLAQINEHDKKYSEDKFSKTALSSITYKNKKVAYPLSFDVGFLVYNNKYVKETPKTFDDIIEYAENFDGEDFPDVMKVLEWNPAEILYNYGFVGAYMECGGENGDDTSIFDITNDNVKSSLKYYTKLQEYFSIEMENVTDKSILDDFEKGKIVYTIASMDSYNYFSEKKIDLKVCEFPDLTTELQSRSLATTNVVVVNPFSNYLRDAERLAMYMTYDKPEYVYEFTGRLSPMAYEYEEENLNAILECYDSAVVMPKLMNTLDYKQRLTVTLNNIWNGQGIKKSLKVLEDEMSMDMKK